MPPLVRIQPPPFFASSRTGSLSVAIYNVLCSFWESSSVSQWSHAVAPFCTASRTTRWGICGGAGGHFDRSDAALLCRSVRWQITDEDRGKIKRKLIDALEMATRPRDIASLSKALIACEAQNQRDDLLLAKQDSRNPEEQELKITVEHVDVSLNS